MNFAMHPAHAAKRKMHLEGANISIASQLLRYETENAPITDQYINIFAITAQLKNSLSASQ